jgi:predicted regulator of Ras-like GTPase activity (Roadblock/LC7/MglB family)
MKRVVEHSPGAIGAAFAASDGEMVDAYTTIDPNEFAIITAHYGVVLSLLDSAFGTFHFGTPEYFFSKHKELAVLVHTVDAGYFALVAYTTDPDLDTSLSRLLPACALLKKEME